MYTISQKLYSQLYCIKNQNKIRATTWQKLAGIRKSWQNLATLSKKWQNSAKVVEKDTLLDNIKLQKEVTLLKALVKTLTYIKLKKKEKPPFQKVCWKSFLKKIRVTTEFFPLKNDNVIIPSSNHLINPYSPLPLNKNWAVFVTKNVEWKTFHFLHSLFIRNIIFWIPVKLYTLWRILL